MTSYCIGRNVIALPATFALANESSGTFKLAGVADDAPEIWLSVTAHVTPAQFVKRLAARRAELTRSPDKTMDVLHYEKSLSSLATLYRVNRIKDAYISEINFLHGGNHIVATLNSYHGTFLDAEKQLLDFAGRVDIGNHPGQSAQRFCVGNVTVQGNFKHEEAKALFRDSRHYGTSFGIDFDSFRPDERVSLLERTTGPDSLLTKFEVGHTVYRKRELTVSGMRAQEWLASFKLGPTGNEKRFGFAMETMRPSPGKFSPYLHLSFETSAARPGHIVDEHVMSDKDAIALWDSVVRSIQPRRQ